MFSFSRLIESSLGSVATKFNFFIHNLAQLRFSGLPSNDEPILSFSAKTYSLKQDGRIKQVSVFTYQKRYNPDKHYVSMWELFPLREDNGLFSPNQTQRGQLTKTGQRNIPQCIMSLSAVNLGVEEESRGQEGVVFQGGCLGTGWAWICLWAVVIVLRHFPSPGLSLSQPTDLLTLAPVLPTVPLVRGWEWASSCVGAELLARVNQQQYNQLEYRLAFLASHNILQNENTSWKASRRK